LALSASSIFEASIRRTLLVAAEILTFPRVRTQEPNRNPPRCRTEAKRYAANRPDLDRSRPITSAGAAVHNRDHQLSLAFLCSASQALPSPASRICLAHALVPASGFSDPASIPSVGLQVARCWTSRPPIPLTISKPVTPSSPA
jgi:hypothetical protein